MTKERILKEAEKMFAQRGYHGATVRDITKASRCNLAAVNYHFGNKWNLYLSVFQFRWMPRAKLLMQSFKSNLSGENPSSATEIVKSLAKAALDFPIPDEEHVCHALLIIRELAKPTEAFKIVVKEALEPLFEEIANRLRPFMPEGLEENKLKLKVFSIFALTIHFNFARTAISQLTGRKYDDDFKTTLEEHIMGFSLIGLGAGGKGESG